MNKIIKTLLAGTSLGLCLAWPAHANLIFDAQFNESWFDATDQSDSSTDDLEGDRPDQFLFALTQDGPGIFDVTIDAIFLFFDNSENPIVVDLDDPEPAFVNGNQTGDLTSGVVAFFDLINDGDPGFGLGFVGFGVGDGFAYNVDVDDENAVVRGIGGGPGFSNFAGSTAQIFYTDNDVEIFDPLVITFGACENEASDCAAASGRIEATDLTPVDVPAPATLALIGLGLLGVAGARRRRS